MQAELWKKIESLYQAALAQPPENRAAFIEQACPDDPLICREVHSLLAQKAASFFETAPMSAAPALGAGTRLGNFEIVSLLGRGGMGEVWRARDSRLKREVAIKTLPSAFAADHDRIARFEREARAASALNHPNIVTVHDIGREDGVAFIVSELVEGETLARLIEHGVVPLRRLIDIGTQIADGLTAAHAAGVVHRDLKPGNVMLTSGGRVKILDFGLARQDRIPGPESTTAHISNPGAILGTPGYMSPEQVRGEAADARSDIFAFGVVLHEMACGKPPFRGGSSVEIMNSILNDEPAELAPASPPALDRIVRRCLEKQPVMRFQCAADLGFALASIPATQATLAPLQKRASWLLWTAVVTASLAGCVAAWWLGSHSERPSTQPDMTIRPLTNSAGTAWDPAISPDGKLVAYTSDQADPNNLEIFVQPVDGGSSIRITDNPADDDSPTFSPDGSQIAFHSDREGGGIFVAPALGGEARLLIPQGRRPRFSPDGKLLMYSTGLGSGDRLYVQQAAGVASGYEPVRIGAGCQTVTENAVWSPDSRHILFIGGCGPISDNGDDYVWLSTPDGKRTTGPRLFPRFRGGIDQWLPNPSRLLLGGAGGSSIATLPVSEDGARITGTLQRLTFVTGSVDLASEASDGRIAFSSGTWDTHIWGIPINGQYRATGPPRRLTSKPAEEFRSNFALSRNGEGLVFAAADGIHYMNLTTGQDREIYSGDGDIDVFRPDGTTILITLVRPASKTGTVYEIPIRGGAPRKLWDEVGGWANPSDWAPDGSTLLYLPWHPPEGRGKILEKDLKSLATTAFLDDAEYEVWNAHFSHDGRWVTFDAEKDGHSEVFVVPFRKGPVPHSEWVTVTGDQGGDKPAFSYDDRVIFFTSDRDGFLCIWAQRLGPDMHPVGTPFAVYHFHQRRRALTNIDLSVFTMAVAPKVIVFNLAEVTAKIWLLDPAKSNSQ